MPSRNSQQCQTRRKPSLGKLRRAHPASGATWNVQVVRGKMTTKCLWHACRALVLGIFLMLLGAGMATLGYYAEHLSIGSEVRGNATVRVKNESRGFHLNNFSYAGPIIMGFGGFIVVAACVMTFEARDSAAKVVPARIKATGSGKSNPKSNSSSATSQRRANGIMQQKTRWDHHLGVFRTSPAEPLPKPPLDRQALTAALVHFSKTLGNSPRQSPRQSPHQSPKLRRFSHTGSVPNLTIISPTPNNRFSANHLSAQTLSPGRKQIAFDQVTTHRYQRHLATAHQRSGHHHYHHHGRHLSKSRSGRTTGSLVQRTTRESSSSLLHPGMLHKFHRHAISVDETGPYCQTTMDGSPHNGSLSSVMVSVDSHEARLRDRTKRSDTAKRHVLARQKPIEKEEPHSPKLEQRRRSSTFSDASNACRWVHGRASSVSRTPSIDSRSVQAELHSPERSQRPSPRSPLRFNSGPTPSIEKEFRSQLSVCSEPSTVMRQLSGQSSLEPCVLEESPELEEIAGPSLEDNSPPDPVQSKKSRPDTLQLTSPARTLKSIQAKKYLFRSNSSTIFYRPKPKPISEYDQISMSAATGTSTTTNDDEFYDSLRVIDERRKKILRSESEACSGGGGFEDKRGAKCDGEDRSNLNVSLDVEPTPVEDTRIHMESESNPNV